MKITIIAVGKIKKKYIVDAMQDYIKQMPVPFEIVEVDDEKEQSGMEKEEQRILSKIKDSDYVIGLAIKGKMLSSEDFSAKIDEIATYTSKDVAFIIGGSYGFTQKIHEKCDYLLSYSKMTLPHQLMRLVLVEQIYRAFQIKRNHPYHK
ncbi:MAG TPA: 23S rRNA (pseudouridine(1915)-N(3))-methyltransferase RlmH [Acholeplasmataceae bacterium]|nr:23S rRNA (pseudouridine(1915)-N(3))-methyltransferase RlmH [Acholeplasmataceae bacterium]